MLDDLFGWLEADNHKIPGVMTGKVINNFNPLKPAAVQVRIPDGTEGMNITAWARVAMPFAGDGRGNYSLPDVGDEVVLAFCNGEIDMPIVVGSLYGSASPPPSETANPLNTVKCLKTKSGNLLKIDDTPGQIGIEIMTAAKLGLKMDDVSMSVTIKDSSSQNIIVVDGAKGEISVGAAANISVKAGACRITLDGAGQSATLKAPNVNIKADNALNLEGAQVSVKGTVVSVEGKTGLDLKSSAMTNVKGTPLKLN
ncbi:MAG: phage baseplate assembly protein V [Oscillospiraceae bacterium]|jgi:uncharacterized protein involved in type VI secretion and phage assembly|nr:phage baseplate assembly protein V [Oscillospiraceae bacterium]